MTTRLLRLSDVLERVPVGRSTWHRLVSLGEVPPPVKVGGAALWRERDIDRLIDTGTWPPGRGRPRKPINTVEA